jgi:hypothetical protein
MLETVVQHCSVHAVVMTEFNSKAETQKVLRATDIGCSLLHSYSSVLTCM